MKFRFCGDGDCPDWVLAEILSTLSVLSSVKLRILAVSVAKGIAGQEISEEKVREIFSTSKAEVTSPKSAIACIRFLLINAARYNTDEATFGEELQQLGLPKEHAASLCRVLSDNLAEIRKQLIQSTLKVNELGAVAYTIPKDVIDCVQLKVSVSQELVGGVPKDVAHTVNIHRADLAVLISNLKQVKGIMDKYDYEGKYKFAN